jgi:hypothetical protein
MFAVMRAIEAEPRSAAAKAYRAEVMFWIGLAPLTLGFIAVLVGIPMMFWSSIEGEYAFGLSFEIVCIGCGLISIAASLPLIWFGFTKPG